jgi:hypothetical protein
MNYSQRQRTRLEWRGSGVIRGFQAGLGDLGTGSGLIYFVALTAG